ncbi:hypothetical protein ACFO0N_03560 [Halobium salinum]|uniref:Uncharacterized protein n=1 Tax=Halobium salinum TaxID=1364940 RepID=A0ABD5P8M0_9EURY
MKKQIVPGLLSVGIGCWLLADPTAPYRPFVSFRFAAGAAIYPMVSFGLGLFLAWRGGKTLVGVASELG